MRFLNSLATIAIFSASACAHKAVQQIELNECRYDVASGGAICSDGNPDQAYIKPAKDLDGYICRNPLADEAFWNACLLQRKAPRP